MSFTVMNSVRGTKDEIPQVVLELQLMGLDALGRLPGFRLLRLMVSEDKTEVVTVMEWDSRDHFVSYRQSDLGRRMVENAVRLHPQISFYEVVTSLESGK